MNQSAHWSPDLFGSGSYHAVVGMYQPVAVLSRSALRLVFGILIGSSVDRLRLACAAMGWCVALDRLACCRSRYW